MIRGFTQMDADFSVRKTGGDPETYAVIGAAMEVHRELRHGFLEAVYQDALAVEFQRRSIPFGREVLLKVFYKGGELPSYYKADFVCFGSLLAECKALAEIAGAEKARVLNCLRATGLAKAVLINFGALSRQYKRPVFTPPQICANLRQSADQS